MSGVMHCVPCCYPIKNESAYYETSVILDLIKKSKMDPKHDHLNSLLYDDSALTVGLKFLEDSDRPDAGKPRC